MIREMKVKRVVKKQTEYLGDLQSLVMDAPTPDSDAAMIQYLKDSIAWLDSLDKKYS
jgi:hypothetical protein